MPRSSTTRTLRLDKDYDELLQRESKRGGMSVNALINKLIQQYVDTLRYYEDGKMISMSTSTFMTVLDQLSQNEIEDLSYGLGTQKASESLMRRGLETNYTNIVWYISLILGEYNGWFRSDFIIGKDVDSLHLSHTHGKKWSYFIAQYVSSILREELGMQVNLVVLENAVNYKITK